MIPYLPCEPEIVFVCRKCNEPVTAVIPERGEQSEKSYCCSARYAIATDTDGGITITRLADKPRREDNPSRGEPFDD